ncbi:hypothetical protein PTTG_27532 [Puccinia triticina 1-1 BBBD Race 1]|uniref:Uncharacterized protein n=1 Tax=Puccinia triticina (isolate 1-1 / race 1 (BBBD)) TaxID=630390 RepID=A0A180GJ16_PUCT1|nr:hypothetical protein PTTG_27532 [Puccinia triticina 1-1 BBBD Race 1]
MSSSTATLWDGKPPSQAAKINAIYSTILPNSQSSSAWSMAAFLQTLLQLVFSPKKPPLDDWKIRPPAHNLHVGSNLPNFILIHPIDAIPPEALLAKAQTIHSIFRTIFLQDLSSSHFPGTTFAWDHPWVAHWNQLFAKFIIKHWLNAYGAGAFKLFFINPVEAHNLSILLGQVAISEEEIQKQNQDPDAALRTAFENIKATSETETTPPRALSKLPLSWQSDGFTRFAQQLDTIYTQEKINANRWTFVHKYILEARRIPSHITQSNSFKNVPRNLPINCYAASYLSTLSNSQQALLNPSDAVVWPNLVTLC